MLSYDEAYAATNPADSEETRDQSARAILLGNRANEVYWNSRSELEALRARADGHGVVVRGPDEGEAPTEVGTGTDAETIEGTATEEPATALGEGDSATASATGATAGTAVPGTPPPEAATPTDTSEADRLREQLRNAGLTPEV